MRYGIQIKQSLLNGSIYPDVARATGSVTYTLKKWHGLSGYVTVREDQMKKAVVLWKKNKSSAYFELGKALHTIQDFYAHRVKIGNKNVRIGKKYLKDVY